MSWLNFFQSSEITCKFHFGRSINASVSPNEEELFLKSYEAFEKKNILDGYKYFFQSLVNFTDNIANKNILLEKKETILHFELYQGCAKITGHISQENFYAETIITITKDAPIALKRYILERNYQLTYVNYFTDEKYIKLKLHLDNIMINPQKIFFPLRELALNANFDKEHIKSEFPDVILEQTQHLIKLNTSELSVKYKYLHTWIDALERKVLILPSNDNAGMQSFLYLNILFKIDYLLTPQYKFSQQLSKIIREYFGDEHNSVEAKNEELKKYLLKIKNLSFQEFSHNFYTAFYTFSQLEKSSFDEITHFISESQTKLKWYKNNRYPQIIDTIYSYIAFHSLYNYGIISPFKELLHLFIQINNSDFFDALGCPIFYDIQNEKLFKRDIVTQIQRIIKNSQQKYKSFAIDSNELNFSSLNKFNHSYYNVLKNLDFEEF